jgi:hypothetical protein
MPRTDDLQCLVLRRSDRQQHRAADTGHGVGTFDTMRVALVGHPVLDVDVVRSLVDGSGHIRFMPCRPAVTGLPGYQNGIGVLDGLRRQRNGREVVELGVLAADLTRGERVADDAQHVDEHVAGLWPVTAHPVVLDGRHAATDTEIDAAVREVVDDAQVFDDLNGMVQRAAT